ncbi:hypothetical protein GCM10020254_32250 [Streptomyces goshikiensis]
MHEGVEALRPAPGAERAGSVRCALLPTHAEELEWLGDSVAHLVRTGTEPREIAVLCRSGGDFARIQAVLVARDVPVEVVGLSGLLHLPEVADLVAVCEVLQDPGANAALVRLLIGPRWRIGARDLALLGRRARQLVARPPGEVDPDERLAAAVEGVDPVEVVSLADALETFLDGSGHSSAAPVDELPFSAQARVRFAHLARELRDLRRSLADPLMDVLHRVLATTGLDVELSASPHALAARRRETLSNFMDVAAGFASLDGEASLLAFLSFLRTAAQYEKGLDHALPGGENTVKVLTAHKSKGLEWDVVVVPDLCAGSFPKEKAPEAWTSYAKVLPYALRGDAETLPGDPAWTSAGLKSFKAALKSHKEVEELRLGYVTFTRPRSLLLASGHWWGPTQKRRRGPSAFLDALRRHCEAGHGEIEAWADEPDEDAVNPALATSDTPDHSWPLPLDPASLALRRHAAALVESHLAAPPPAAPAAPADDLWPEADLWGADGDAVPADPADPAGDEPWPQDDPWSEADPWPADDADAADVEDAPAPGGDDPWPDAGAAVPGGAPVPGRDGAGESALPARAHARGGAGRRLLGPGPRRAGGRAPPSAGGRPRRPAPVGPLRQPAPAPRRRRAGLRPRPRPPHAPAPSPRRARARASTPGWSPASTSSRSRSSTSSTPRPSSPAATRRSPTRPTSTPSRRPSSGATTPSAPPTAWRSRSS